MGLSGRLGGRILRERRTTVPLDSFARRLRGKFGAKSGAVTATLVTVVALLTVLFGLASQPARADLQNPRQDFLRASTSGLFLHWGMLTSPGYTSCSAWETAIKSGNWSADYWVSEAQKLHASYITLATFHSKLGYGRAWPSSIPGTCSTQRDFLGELITAAHNATPKIEVILYMTNDAQWHNLNNHEWMDSTAYSNYKGHPVDLDTQAGFGEYSYDNFFDVMKTHPTLDGFWIDNDNQYWLDHNLYAQIYQLHPNMTISNNNEDTPIMDMISNEQKTGMTPAYDMPQAYYTAQPRLTEADYKLPGSGAWWYDGSNSTVDTALNVGRYIANAGNSVKSLMAETAMVELRLVEGLRLEAFARRFHTDFQAVFGARLGEVWSAGLLEMEGDALRLTDRGRLLGNEVFARLLPDTPAES